MRLAVFGVGTVGESVLKLAGEKGHEIVAVADSKSAAVDPDGLDPEKVLSRKNYRDQVGSEDVEDALAADYDVLIEATPTTLDTAEPGFTNVRTALERDRHAVLANKGPVAQRYDELREIEAKSDGAMLFEATVGGAIPVLSTISDHAGEVSAVRGVLNGTANFILSRMSTEELDYEHILAEAQDLGVAEEDPSFDVRGTDTALKCVILANVLKDGGYTLADAEVDGIEDLPGSALEVSAQDGHTIRLLGEVSADGTIRVGPRLVPENSSLAVSGTLNIVQFETENAETLNLSGQGAGGSETASAVLSDVRRLERMKL